MSDVLVEVSGIFLTIWATTWPNQQNECAPSDYSGQPGHHRVWSEFSLCAQRVAKDPSFLRLRIPWSEWSDVQADLSLRWSHTHFVSLVMSRLIRNVIIFAKEDTLIPHTRKSWMWTEMSKLRKLPVKCHWSSLKLIFHSLDGFENHYFSGIVPHPKFVRPVKTYTLYLELLGAKKKYVLHLY